MYHYAGNNPVKYVDPDGNDVEDAIPLTDSQKNMIADAQKNAIDDISSLINRLSGFDGIDDELANNAIQFLGINVSYKISKNRLIEDLNKIKDDLKNMKDYDFKFDPNPSSNDENAYVLTKSNRPMYGESLFGKTIYFTKNGFSSNLKETLLHETAHKSLNLTIENETYGLDACVGLPSQLKSLNASNWSFFISRSK